MGYHGAQGGGDEKDAPLWYTHHKNKEGKGITQQHKDLKSAVAHLKSAGHSIPDHHISTLKAKALAYASDKVKKPRYADDD